MDSLRRVSSVLSIPQRTLRRAAAEGLLRGERVSPRRFLLSLREEAYLRSHWPLLSALRAALRTEPNVRLAVLFGSTANGSEHEDSDVDVLVALSDSDPGRLVELTGRLGRRIGRGVQIVTVSAATQSATLMLDVIEQGRVLVDREDLWRGLKEAEPRWRRKARRAERIARVALDERLSDSLRASAQARRPRS
jgi:predicted nucleotidyltransferase